MDNKIVPKYINGQKVGIYDYGKGQCIPVESKSKTESGKQTAANKPKADPKAERGFWQQLLFGGPSPITLTGCPNSSSTSCERGASPKFDTYANSIPKVIQKSDLEEGVSVAWKLLVTNCDDSIQDVKVVCHFYYRDGTTEDLEFYPDQDGIVTVAITLFKELAKAPKCDLHYINPNSPEKKPEPLKNVITLYGPDVIPDTDEPPECTWPYPQIHGRPQTDPPPSEIYAGQPVKIYHPRWLVEFCGVTGADPENELDVSFLVKHGEYTAGIDQDNYYTIAAFEDYGDQEVEIIARYGNLEARKSISFYVKDPSAATTRPSATISSNLKYAHHVGDIVDNITCYSDDPDATFAWKVTRPGPDEFGDVVQEFAGATFPVPYNPYLFDLEGDYDFKCEVTAGDGVTKNSETRPVGVYPVNQEFPPASIVAPFAAEVGEDVDFICPSADEALYSYSWEFRDGSGSLFGPSVVHAFQSEGTYQVELTVARLDNPDIMSVITQNITIVPVAVETPSLSIVAPPAVHEDTLFTLRVGNPDEANFEYTWEFGDGTPLAIGATVTHTYNDPGQYAIILRAASRAHPEHTFTSAPYNIYVIQDSAPLPSLSIVAPYAATVDSSVNFQVADPDLANYNYSFNFGDGTPIAPGTNLNHTFTDLGTYSVILCAALISDPSTIYEISQNISIVPYPVPSVGIDGPFAAPVDTTVDFFVPEPTPGATYAWTFGDGSNANGTSVSHRYTRIGDFEVRLTGDLNGSTNYVTHKITIYTPGG